MTTNANEKPWEPKRGDYVRIKADCLFHGMVGKIEFVHGRDIGVFIPCAYMTNSYENSLRVYLVPNQLWPATEEEYETVRKARRLQTPQEVAP